MKENENIPDGSTSELLRRIDRLTRRDRLREKIRELGGLVGGAEGEEVSDAELSFLEHVLAWENGPRSSHRTWLARSGQTFMPPAELDGEALKRELWRLIHALAGARVFFYHTNHLSDSELYGRLWTEVLPTECPDGVRTKDDACHWDFADAGSGEEEVWLRYYASRSERHEWGLSFPDTQIPERQRPPYRRDHRLPIRD
jgi:hypothetical protein